MILRRVRKHVQAQDWFAVGIDFIIVVLGILLAFQITECSNRSALHAKQNAAVRDMLGESVEIVRYLRDSVDSWDSRIAVHEEAVAALTAKDLGTMTESELGYSLAGMSALPAITPPRDVYDTLAASGDLDLIADRGARREISRYYAELEFVQKQLEYWREFTVARYSVSHPGLVSVYDPDSPQRMAVRTDFRKLSSDPKFVQQSVEMLRNQAQFQRFRRRLLEQAESMCLMMGEAANLPCIAYEENE